LVFSVNLTYSDVSHCCTGTVRSDDMPGRSVEQSECEAPANAKCVTEQLNFANVLVTTYFCGDSSASGTGTCSSDYCNCPPQDHKSISEIEAIIGNMRSIMYPILGIVFGILWVILAFVGAAIPPSLLLLIVGFIDAVFGVFLIFLPVTAFLGLLYIALGDLTIAAARHYVGEKVFWFLVILTVITFFLTGGLTVIAWHGTYVADFVTRIADATATCERDLNIDDWDNHRCENYALFVVFCVFLLFLVQPIALLAAFLHRHNTKSHSKEETHTTVHQHTTPS